MHPRVASGPERSVSRLPVVPDHRRWHPPHAGERRVVVTVIGLLAQAVRADGGHG